MNNVDKQYLDFLRYILENGELKEDRTGTGTLSVFDYSMSFDMSEGFPLLTSKRVFTKAVIHELIWFLKGDTNIKYLVENGVGIWNGDAFKNYITKTNEYKGDWPDNMEEFIKRIKFDEDFASKWGELGPVYGAQWRSWTKVTQHGGPLGSGGYIDFNYIDQISNLVNDLKTKPDSRRLMVMAWNVGEIDEMVLPPCHFGFQCYTNKMTLNERIEWWCKSIGKDISYGNDMTDELLDEKRVPKRKLSLKWFQRSVDSFLGLPFNISSYGILLHLLAKEVNMVPHMLKFNGGDCHIYLNHIEQCKLQMSQDIYKLPNIILSNSSIFDISYDDIKIVNYISSPIIRANLSN